MERPSVASKQHRAVNPGNQPYPSVAKNLAGSSDSRGKLSGVTITGLATGLAKTQGRPGKNSNS
jgi:hypothetical protein